MGGLWRTRTNRRGLGARALSAVLVATAVAASSLVLVPATAEAGSSIL
jgi:hypothetical protein